MPKKPTKLKQWMRRMSELQGDENGDLCIEGPNHRVYYRKVTDHLIVQIKKSIWKSTHVEMRSEE